MTKDNLTESEIIASAEGRRIITNLSAIIASQSGRLLRNYGDAVRLARHQETLQKDLRKAREESDALRDEIGDLLEQRTQFKTTIQRLQSAAKRRGRK